MEGDEQRATVIEIKDTFLWNIKDFKNETESNLYSPTFTSKFCDDVKWRLLINPYGDGRDNRGYVSIKLCPQQWKPNNVTAKVGRANTTESDSFMLQYAVWVLSPDDIKRKEKKMPAEDFSMVTRGNGWGKWISRDDLDELLVDGTLRVRAEVAYAEINSVSAVEYVEQMLDRSKASFKLKDTINWTIKNFKDASRRELHSELFTSRYREDIKWRLHVCATFSDRHNPHDYVRILLSTARGEKNPVRVNCTVWAIGRNDEKMNEFRFEKDFNKSLSDSKWTSWLKFPDSEVFTWFRHDQLDDVLVDGALTIRADISYVEVDGRPSGEYFEKLVSETSSAVSMLSVYRDKLKQYEQLIGNDDSDFKIRVDDQEIGVHKLILRQSWPYFANMLAANMKECETAELIIENHSYTTIRRMINYIYTGIADFDEIEPVLELFAAANEYEVTQLAQDCIDYASDNITRENVVVLYLFATKSRQLEFGEHAEYLAELKKRCEEWLIKKKREEKIMLQQLPNYAKLTSVENHDILVTLLTTVLDDFAG